MGPPVFFLFLFLFFLFFLMKPATVAILLIIPLVFGQSSQTAPRFEIADVQVSSPTSAASFRTPWIDGGRYELKNATMLDLIRTAYGFEDDKILGGPSWLEMDRFDVLAKLPADATPETVKLMLQSLLADRFKLVLHKDTKPFPAYALTVGKQPQLGQAVGGGDAGFCSQQPVSGPPGTGRMVQYNCRNTTMAAFAAGLRRMAGALMDPIPVVDQTGLGGKWNFDLTFSPQQQGLNVASVGGQLTLAGAIDRQLGLKLEERQIPVPVSWSRA